METRMTPAQERFMTRARENGGVDHRPTNHGRNTGRACRAWDRTAEALARMGMVRVVGGCGGGATARAEVVS